MSTLRDPCTTARLRASLATDRELGAVDAARLRLHLLHCGDCREYERGLVRVARVVRSAAPAHVRHPVLRAPRLALLRPAGGLAAAAVAVLLMVTALGHRGPPQVSAQPATEGLPAYSGLSAEQGLPAYVAFWPGTSALVH